MACNSLPSSPLHRESASFLFIFKIIHYQYHSFFIELVLGQSKLKQHSFSFLKELNLLVVLKLLNYKENKSEALHLF